MIGLRVKLEALGACVAFAERGERETANQMLSAIRDKSGLKAAKRQDLRPRAAQRL